MPIILTSFQDENTNKRVAPSDRRRARARARNRFLLSSLVYAVIIAGTSWNNTAPAHCTVAFSSLNPDYAPRTLYSRVSWIYLVNRSIMNFPDVYTSACKFIILGRRVRKYNFPPADNTLIVNLSRFDAISSFMSFLSQNSVQISMLKTFFASNNSFIVATSAYSRCFVYVLTIPVLHFNNKHLLDLNLESIIL